jgi:predicted Zn-ribbon and HTH transcriptional regulator
MVLYRCLCGYETDHKNHIKKHLNRHTSCMKNKDMSKIKIDELVIEGVCKKITYENLSYLTEEEKKERRKQQNIKYNTEIKMLGKMSLENFSKILLHNLKNHCKIRNHEEPSWSVLDIKELLEKNSNYIISDTIIGDLTFPLKLTNGYHNSASIDRINNNLSYSVNNIEIRPHFLNTVFKLTTEDIRELIKLREQKQNESELIEICKYINKYDSKHFFYGLAKNAKTNSDSQRDKIFDFPNIKSCGVFLISKYIEQGGRCAYSHIPIYPKTSHKYRVSIERINPLLGYSKNNILLIVVGLNGSPAGQFLNKNIDEENRQNALSAGKFNQEYWDNCTKITPDIMTKCTEARDYGRTILKEHITIQIS